MKNVRMILSAFAVLAIVGSALAFKAKAFTNPNVFCLASGTTTGACSNLALVAYVTDPSGIVTLPCAGIGTTVPHVTAVVGGVTKCINSLIPTYTVNN